MCATCGCGIPDDDHGDARHVTWLELVAAAEAADIPIERAVANIVDMLEREDK